MKKIFILLGFLLSIMAFACTNDNQLGADIMPSSDRPNLCVVDNFSLKMQSEKETSFTANNPTNLIFGFSSDKFCGNTFASFAAFFDNSSYQTYPDDCKLDSCVLKLGLKSNGQKFCGDSSQTMTINVYPIKEKLLVDSIYNWDMDLTPLVDKSNLLGSKDVVAKKLDSLLSIRISNEYAQQIINAEAIKMYDSTFYGLYVTPEISTNKGCLIKVPYANENTELVVYYSDSKGSHSNVYSIETNSPRFNHFEHDYTSSLMEEQFNNPKVDEDTICFLQLGGGSRFTLQFDDITNIAKDDSKYFSLQSAKVYLPLADSASVEEGAFPVVDDISFYGVFLENGKQKYFTEYSTTNTDGTATYNSIYLDKANRRYVINITARLLEMIKDYPNGALPYKFYVSGYTRISEYGRSIINTANHKTNPAKIVVEYITYDKN